MAIVFVIYCNSVGLRQHPYDQPDDISPLSPIGQVGEINNRGLREMNIESVLKLLGITALLAFAMNQVQESVSAALTISFSISLTLKMNTQLRKQAGLIFCH